MYPNYVIPLHKLIKEQCTFTQWGRLEIAIVQSEETKVLFRKGCLEMISEYQDKMTQMMNIYKQNPTFPYDFYNLSLREADTKILAIMELYRRITGEDLEKEEL